MGAELCNGNNNKHFCTYSGILLSFFFLSFDILSTTQQGIVWFYRELYAGCVLCKVMDWYSSNDTVVLLGLSAQQGLTGECGAYGDEECWSGHQRYPSSSFSVVIFQQDKKKNDLQIPSDCGVFVMLCV